MRYLAGLALVALGAVANINFHWVQPACDSPSGCLPGQTCLNDTCAHQASVRDAPVYSTDGRCGPTNGGLVCDPDTDAYSGTCCSQYGWCGSTDAYCGAGCVAGCDGELQTTLASAKAAITGTTALVPTMTTAITMMPTQSAISKSQAVANSEPVVGQQPASTAAAATPNGAVTTDGTCGALHGNTVCGNWPRGSCCSMYGYCGNTTAHCGAGCQSGPCLGIPVVAAPAASPAPAASDPGAFEIIGQSGVPAMHAALMENGRMVFLDKIENYTQLKLPDGQYAYSSEFDPNNPGNQALPLQYKTNAFCSGGTFLSDGRLLNIGGNAPLSFIDPTVGDGFRGLRYLERSATDSGLTGQPWSEPGNELNTARWYASAQTMPNGNVFVASGSLNGLDPSVAANNNPTFEILSPDGISSGQSVAMDILEKNQPYYMYPFMHLLNDGSLFVFVAKSAEQFNVETEATVKHYPDLPGEYRTYPNTGGSVILPFSSANDYNPDVVICGGGAYQALTSPTEPSCGRINPLNANAAWEMDAMPEGRVMVEGTLLPDGSVIWLNGGSEGAQGFGLAESPALEALIYDPNQPLGERFSVGASSTIPRLYHSVALLAIDGTLIVTGSNPVEQPILTPDAADPYVTEFRVERYTPPYLTGDNPNRRPQNMVLSTTRLTANAATFRIEFDSPVSGSAVNIALYYGGFVTHSLHMGQRMIYLDNTGYVAGASSQVLTVTMPPNSNVAPPGPYVVYVVQDGIPSIGQSVMVN